MSLQFLDIKELKPEEAEILAELAGHYHDKIKIKIPKFLLKVHVKKQKKTGHRQKYSMHLKLETPNTLAVSETHDWDLNRTIHNCFKKLERELQHKLKLEGHLPKPK